MIFEPTPLEGSFLITLSPKGDERGWLMRTYCKSEFQNSGIDCEFVQCNQTFTKEKGTIRGMHFQKEPAAEIKLVRCLSGSVLDVIVDLRPDSKTYLKWFAAELSDSNLKMMLVPKGFAHGFQTLTDDVQMFYQHSEYYSPELESGVLYNDPKIGIEWPLELTNISNRDKNHNLLK